MLKVWHDPVTGERLTVGLVQRQPSGVIAQIKDGGERAGRLIFIEQAIWDSLESQAAAVGCDCGASSVKDMTHATWCNTVR